MLTYEFIFYRLLVSCLCGALIGFEREKHGRAAGLRTHMLVSLGSAAIMIMSLMILDLHKNSISHDLNYPGSIRFIFQPSEKTMLRINSFA